VKENTEETTNLTHIIQYLSHNLAYSTAVSETDEAAASEGGQAEGCRSVTTGGRIGVLQYWYTAGTPWNGGRAHTGHTRTIAHQCGVAGLGRLMSRDGREVPWPPSSRGTRQALPYADAPWSTNYPGYQVVA